MVAINWYKDTEIGTDSNYFWINVKLMRTDNKLWLCLISLPKPQLLTNTSQFLVDATNIPYSIVFFILLLFLVNSILYHQPMPFTYDAIYCHWLHFEKARVCALSCSKASLNYYILHRTPWSISFFISPKERSAAFESNCHSVIHTYLRSKSSKYKLSRLDQLEVAASKNNAVCENSFA